MREVKSIEELIESYRNDRSEKCFYIFKGVQDKRLNKILKKYYPEESIQTQIKFQITTDGIRHILKKHGGDYEKERGQILVILTDMLLIPTIVNSADNVIQAGETKRGTNAIKYIKKLGFKYYCIEEIFTKDGKKLLNLKTLYKKPL